jgi:hypothetical protein
MGKLENEFPGKNHIERLLPLWVDLNLGAPDRSLVLFSKCLTIASSFRP